MRKLAADGTIAALGAANRSSKIAVMPANNVIAGAKSQMVAKYGIGAYVRPKMWYLSLLKASFSQPLLIGIIVIVAMLSLWIYLFGWISLWYALYMVKAELAVVLNVMLSVANAIWFAFHGFTRILLFGFFDVINAIAHFFIEPVAQGVVNVIGYLGMNLTVNISSLGEGLMIDPQPSEGFAYYIPTSAAWGFIAMKPGFEIYVTDAQGDIVYDFVYDSRGAKLLMPRINPDAEAGGEWWCKIGDRPPDGTYNPAVPFEIHAFMGITLWEQIKDVLFGWWDDWTGPTDEKLASPMTYQETWIYWDTQVEDELGFLTYHGQDVFYQAINPLKYWGGFWEYVFEHSFWENRNTIAIAGGESKWSNLEEQEAQPLIKDWLNSNKHIWHPDYWGNRW